MPTHARPPQPCDAMRAAVDRIAGCNFLHDYLNSEIFHRRMYVYLISMNFLLSRLRSGRTRKYPTPFSKRSSSPKVTAQIDARDFQMPTRPRGDFLHASPGLVLCALLKPMEHLPDKFLIQSFKRSVFFSFKFGCKLVVID